MSNTLENFGSGILGNLILFIGFIFLFVNLFIGIAIMLFGAYLKYKSKTYVHTN